jgi:hypothetical protein
MGGIYPLSDIRANTISDTSGNGPINLTGQSAAKAWVNFDGLNVTANTDMIGVRNSLNISSIVDVNVGHYRLNYASSMDSNGYAASALSNHHGNVTVNTTVTTTEWRAERIDLILVAAGIEFDANPVSGCVIGDLA